MVYWNEYDHGSEAGDNGDDTYAIYIDPDATVEFPGVQYLKSIMSGPTVRIREWLKSTRSPLPNGSDTQSLLHSDQTGSPRDYFSIRKPRSGSPTDNEGTEEEYASSEDAALSGPHHRSGDRPPRSDAVDSGFLSALEEADQQDLRMAHYRDSILARSIVLFYAASFALLLVSGLLVTTGRHKLRLEVDAGATVGSVASLFCACMGLGALFARRFIPTWLYSLAVWAAFAASTLLNGMLLIIVVRSSGI